MDRARQILTLSFGGAVWGSFIGIGAGALLGCVYGVLNGNISFSLDGALHGWYIVALCGALYGAVLGLTDNKHEFTAHWQPADTHEHAPAEQY
ncbi:MAG: hypothetical protein AB7K24_20425 [Gemmataceae bacterium]